LLHVPNQLDDDDLQRSEKPENTDYHIVPRLSVSSVLVGEAQYFHGDLPTFALEIHRVSWGSLSALEWDIRRVAYFRDESMYM
jgi:hypothetical protein